MLAAPATSAHLIGPELFTRLRGNWRAGRATEVSDVLADPDKQVWVAEVGHEAIGLVAATLHRDARLGEIYMIAVDPKASGAKVGVARKSS